jgi:DNA-binding NarL/FixJ family response regulator
MNKVIRIVLVDGRELVRYGLRHMLESEEDMKVVGDYASAEEALFEMIRLHGEIIIMGMWMPGMSWLEATRSLNRNSLYSGVDVIILAESEHYRAEAMEAGAASYLLKDTTHTELAQAIRQVYRDRHSSKECDGLVEDAVELVIPPSANAAYLLSFMYQLAEILHDGFASIICTVGSWNRGTVITIRPSSTTHSSLVIALANMAEVEKVEEEPLTRGAFPSFTKKFGLLPKLGINPDQRLRITLKEADTARQGLVTALN